MRGHLRVLLLAAAVATAGRARAAPLEASPKARVQAALHVVRAGEQLGRIAQRYGLDGAELRRANRLPAGALLRAGQTLALPLQAHTVRAGETLSDLASSHHTSVEALSRLNRLGPLHVLAVGEALLLPAPPSSTTAEQGPRARSGEATAADPVADTPPAGGSSAAAPAKPPPPAGEPPGALNADGPDPPGPRPLKPSPAKHAPPDEPPATPPQPQSAAAPRRSKAASVTSSSAQAGVPPSPQLLALVRRWRSVAPTQCRRHQTAPGWCAYTKKPPRRGYVTLTGHGRSWHGYVLGRGERVLPAARRAMAWVLASWRTGRTIDLDEGLVRLIVTISDELGGRPLRIVSGYREHSHARYSRHKVGKAVDFSVPGMPNAVLRDYLRTLEETGVGYYPNSTHVHVDVREGQGYWVDVSRPGTRPKYAEQRSAAAPEPSGDAATAARGPRAQDSDERNAATSEPSEDALPAARRARLVTAPSVPTTS